MPLRTSTASSALASAASSSSSLSISICNYHSLSAHIQSLKPQGGVQPPWTPTPASSAARAPCPGKPLAGFEAVLLALYAHAAAQRGAGEVVAVSIPNLANPRPYHDAKVAPKAKPAEIEVAVLSPPLEQHGTMRSMRRARLVGAIRGAMKIEDAQGGVEEERGLLRQSVEQAERVAEVAWVRDAVG
nr:unnamed protein product [Digitaria exilis]